MSILIDIGLWMWIGLSAVGIRRLYLHHRYGYVEEGVDPSWWLSLGGPLTFIVVVIKLLEAWLGFDKSLWS